MISAAIPATEAERLEALASYGVLDSEPELGFDDLTALASQILGMPIALVSLVDAGRQWFKSRQGLDAPETPRDLAFCAHAILQAEPFVVADALDDVRFHDNPLVTGGPFVRSYAGVPLITPDGHALGTLCVIDHRPRQLSSAQLTILEMLGRQVVTQLELRRTRGLALRASAAKSEFLATMSHEIRTPLNGVLGLTDLLLDTPLSAPQRELASTVRACGDHLLAVLNDVLDFSKLESGKLTIEHIAVDVAQLLSQVVAVMAPAARAKGLTLEATCALGQASHRVGDPTRIRQGLLNLLGNAIKFTAAGRVTARVEARGSATEVRFTVCDTGIGIAAEHLPALFQRFSQGDSSMTRRYGGTGLGLAITRRIIDLMGGQVGVTSELGVGSEFWFQLPLAHPAPLEREPVVIADDRAASSLQGLRVLVADDSATNRVITTKLLQRLGCCPMLAETGASAIDAWRTGACDIILMDCQMPVMDGLEATRRIRHSGGAHAAIPIIALTASELDADREECLRAGMTGFLSKPINVASLEAALRQAARGRGAL